MHSSRKSGQFGKAMSEALVTVGERFGLYRKIAEIGPATPAEIAHEAGVPEKQVGPWLRSQAEADYLVYEKQSNRFSNFCALPQAA
jgi:hypothetical protein